MKYILLISCILLSVASAQPRNEFGGQVDPLHSADRNHDSNKAAAFEAAAIAFAERSALPDLQVEVNLLWVGFTLEELSHHPEVRSNAMLSQEAVLKLWQEGKGELLDLQKLVTESGVNAQFEQVEELIYPTEFKHAQLPTSTNTAKAGGVLAESFDTRELGGIMNVTATVHPNDKKINIAMIPERASLQNMTEIETVVETNGRATTIRVGQPRIISNNLTVSVLVENDLPLVLCTGRHPTENRIDALILRARCLSADGRFYKKDTPENDAPQEAGEEKE